MQINYLEFGEKGQPIVFLHGWQQSGRSFLPLVTFLSKNYQLFLIDLPGFGRTKKPTDDFSSFDYARLITVWLQKKKLKKIILVGHSFGGKVAAIIGAKNPEMIKKLILIASSGIPHTKTLSKLVSSSISKRIPFKIKRLFASRDYREAGDLLVLFKNIVKEDIQPVFAKINLSTLIIWGKEDRELPVSNGKLMQSLIKKSRLVLVEGDHFPFWQKPKMVAQLISQFINEKD
ncbi:MAG: alpha/beta hydrolase [Candidatus Shapirobacteria bacterium]|nr:alpha/beta hydrolase [Candidatus Shapirobacteria bacterium]